MKEVFETPFSNSSFAVFSNTLKVFGHIEAEEKLKAKLAKKEKNLTQIEMDVCVQDMG